MIGSSRIDDKIKYSWCFNFVEYVFSTSTIINVFIKKLESLSSLISRQTSVRKVHMIALFCHGVAKEYAFESVRGNFGEGRREISRQRHYIQ